MLGCSRASCRFPACARRPSGSGLVSTLGFSPLRSSDPARRGRRLHGALLLAPGGGVGAGGSGGGIDDRGQRQLPLALLARRRSDSCRPRPTRIFALACRGGTTDVRAALDLFRRRSATASFARRRNVDVRTATRSCDASSAVLGPSTRPRASNRNRQWWAAALQCGHFEPHLLLPGSADIQRDEEWAVCRDF